MTECGECGLRFELVICVDAWGAPYCEYCPRCGENNLMEDETDDSDDSWHD